MEHNLCRENLSAYFDGELPPQERAAVEAHLAGCPACRAELAQLGGVSRLVKAHGLEPVPPALKGAVLNAPKPYSLPWFKPVLALSAAAAGLLIVMNITKVQEQSSFSNGFGARGGADMGSLEAVSEIETARALPPEEPAAPAPAAPDAVVSAGARKYSSAAAVRGSYGQAKFAASRTSGALSAGAGAAGAAGTANRTDSFNLAAARPPLAPEFRGKVCVYIRNPELLSEPSIGISNALNFIRKTGTRLEEAAPGRLVFIKNDGTRRTLERTELGSGLIFFDGVKAPYVVQDTAAIALQYDNYFGTAAGR